MNIKNKLEEAKEILSKYNQEHLLCLYDELSNDEKENLINQILRIDFEKILNLYTNSKIKDDYSNIVVSPLNHMEKKSFTNDEISYFTKIGEGCLYENKFAVVTMARWSRNTFRL